MQVLQNYVIGWIFGITILKVLLHILYKLTDHSEDCVRNI